MENRKGKLSVNWMSIKANFINTARELCYQKQIIRVLLD